MSEGGFVAIHNSSGDVIGHSNYLNSGEQTNVDISLSQNVSEDQTLTAMAHKDTDKDQTFDFPDNDEPYTNSTGANVTDSALVTYTSGGATVLSATHYESNDSGPVVEVAFDQSVDVSGTTFTLGFEDGTTTEYQASNNEVTQTDNNRVVVHTSELHSDIQNVSVPDSISSTEDDVSVTFAPTTVNAGESVDGYVGANVAFEASSTETTIDFDGPSFSVTRGTGTGSHVYVVDTDEFETGNYSADFGDGGVGYLNLNSLGLSVSAGDVDADTPIQATVEADDIDRDVDVALLDSDDDVVDTTTVHIDADGQATAEFDSQTAGDYSVVATDVDTGVEASDTLTVSEAPEGDATFTQNTYEVAQGGIAEITVDLAGDETKGTLVVGDETESGYQANVTFTDEDGDGEVTVQFNTYNAGAGATDSGVVSAAGDDTANLNSADTNLDNLLAQNAYNLAVDTGHANNGTEVTESGDADFGALTVGPRSTDSMTLWTAPNNADDVFDAATEDDTIAQNDWVVVQVSASGLEGLVDGDFESTVGDGLNLTVEQTEATTAPNRDPKQLNVSTSSDAVEYFADSDNDSYYVAINTAEADFDQGSSTGLSVEAGEEYTATFTVDDSKLVGDDTQSVNSSFEIVERTASLDETPVMVEAAEGQNITGSSSLAPGSEFRVVVESTGDTSPRFYNNPTATVEADGTWSISLDFSEQAEGDTFSVSNSQFFSADGEVVESTATATATPTETATEAPDTDTETATATATETEAPDTETETEAMDTDTDTEEPDTTTTTTPGFGIAVALVALLAAALLAGRRE